MNIYFQKNPQGSVGVPATSRAPALPKRSREEIEAETQDLNACAASVLAALTELESLWFSAPSSVVPAQHRHVFLSTVKPLDMHTMAQVFQREVEEFKGQRATVLDCIESI